MPIPSISAISKFPDNLNRLEAFPTVYVTNDFLNNKEPFSKTPVASSNSNCKEKMSFIIMSMCCCQ